MQKKIYRARNMNSDLSSRSPMGTPPRPVRTGLKHALSPERSPNRKRNGDRFIPKRSSLEPAAMMLMEDVLETKSKQNEKKPRTSESNSNTDRDNSSYNALLESELFFDENAASGVSAGASNSQSNRPRTAGITSSSPLRRNLFQYMSSDSPQGSPSRNSDAGSNPGTPERSGILSMESTNTPPRMGSGTVPNSEAFWSPLQRRGNSPYRPPRVISKAAAKVLDASCLQDDYYLNLVDWSSQNVLSVGLADCVYLWNAGTGKVDKLCEFGTTDSIASLSWMTTGSHLAVGTATGVVEIWDVQKEKCIKRLTNHHSRVGCMAWNGTQRTLLATGSRDRRIILHDVREKTPAISEYLSHRQEVCGLKWAFDGHQLASGGNDNKLFVWSTRTPRPVCQFNDHIAAVKALAWSPHQNGLLASGGGTADRCIRFWNTVSGRPVSHTDTGSQVCQLAWSKNCNEIVSTHGYSQNQIIVWKYPSMQPLATLTGHTRRVLYLAVSPNGQTIVTGAGDETLRFWSVFPPPKQRSRRSGEATGMLEDTKLTSIR